MSAPREISDLVDRFAEHAEAYRSGAYNETQLRREFVDPMFKALGWDMDNLSGYALPLPDGGVASVRSIWFVESGERVPRLATAYPLRLRKQT